MLIPNTETALPVVTNLLSCANFDKSFAQFLPQLYALPTEIYSALTITTGGPSIQDIYTTTNPAISGLAFAIALCPIFFLVSEFNRNYSQVDRVWSILPTLFNIHYAVWARRNGLPTQRVDNVLAFSVLWTTRLTFNYWRRGGYTIGSEDYRWMIIQKYIGKIGLFVLNVVFISSTQVILLYAVTLPTYLLLLTSRLNPALTASDLIISRLMIALVVFEYFADQQQWVYQGAKKQYQQTAQIPPGWTRAQLDRGFVTTGLWKWSRHPNFAAEQSIWILLYLWSCVETERFGNWTVGGVIMYCMIFQGSTPLTEWISGGKYPEYRVYQRRVGMFVPKLFGRGWSEGEMEGVGGKKA